MLQQAVPPAVVLRPYRHLPRRSVRWRDALPGELLAAVLFQASQEAYLSSTRSFGDRYAAMCGPPHDIAVLLLWAYISAAIVLLGVQFGAAYADRRSGRMRREEASVMQRVWHAGR